ncbi:MAG TPA: histidinol dehydrogenase, partial [Daejeonella sp.]|nr:histidinol dehydrogenase [Daejeonella sp.]
MLRIYELNSLSESEVDKLCIRTADSNYAVQDTVKDIISEVRKHGDSALRTFARQFDQVDIEQLWIGKDELEEMAASVPDFQKEALDIAYNNIRSFHLAQVLKEDVIETMPGVSCWR